jgi:large conductance mechanosensitive channel
MGDIPEVAILYGSFIQAIVDFLIIAFSIFLFLKFLLSEKKKEQEAPPAPAAPNPEIVLLEEIRDLLKTKQ